MTHPKTMEAVQLIAHGGPEMLRYSTDVAVPTPVPGDVLIQVAAAGVNNTDINTRIGWYSKAVTEATNSGAGGFDSVDAQDSSWAGKPFEFPRIQGADACGRIVAVGADVDPQRIGERVLVRSMMRGGGDVKARTLLTFGSECDGAFAQFAVAPAHEAYTIVSDWSDADLASIPCAYSTAENMLHRANVGAERVLITGASGGVGSAAVQLAKRRGAHVIAQCGAAKAADVRALGADETVARDADLMQVVGENSVDVVVDLVAGAAFPSLLDVLCPGGRYVTAGAIGGPIAQIDIRTLYLKDLTLLGATFQEDVVFENLIGYIERNEIRPVVAKTYPLSEIAQAQADFMAKTYTGKLVLIPKPLS